ncbi:MAG: ImmA/IrrE family metallo-endopeptidase [Desulfovibrio sp.]|uniref:ImmA/IrrE family metallo-endopeptidase n=1 Tax=Desulfovibrio sp. 7SRBS1 TaxID=3378064 RepID=UPI003B4267F5
MNTTVPVVPPKSRPTIQREAACFLKKWIPEAIRSEEPIEIDYIYDVILTEHYEIKTGYIDLSSLGIGRGILGFTDAETRQSWITSSLADATDTVGRRRFRATVGHEIGHCIMHVPYLEKFRSASSRNCGELCRACRSDLPAYKDPEWQAWEYGDELLMPTVLLKKLIKEGKNVQDLAKNFDLNPGYIKTRLKKLKIRLS